MAQFPVIAGVVNCMTEFLMVEVLATMKLKGLSSISLIPNYFYINFFLFSSLKFGYRNGLPVHNHLFFFLQNDSFLAGCQNCQHAFRKVIESEITSRISFVET